MTDSFVGRRQLTGDCQSLACRKPPQIKFKLNFGKALGSSATAKPVQAWLDPFLRNTLGDMLVWPNRIVVPILGEDITGPLDHLMLRWDDFEWLTHQWSQGEAVPRHATGNFTVAIAHLIGLGDGCMLVFCEV